MKTILITGATGFLGKHLVEQLKAAEPAARLRILRRGIGPEDRGRRAEAALAGRARLFRAGGQAAVTGPTGEVEVVQGDITSREAVSRAAEGASEIYHLAGVVSRQSEDSALLYRTHVEGTRNVCEAARKVGAQKVVIVSSSGTIAVSREPVIHDETSGYKHDVVGEWPYYLSKIFAEKLALDYFARYELPAVVVNPSLLLGPGDDRLSSTRDIALFLKGEILALPLGGLNFVDARDAAAGLIAAMRSGKPGERYLLGGPNWTFREMMESVSRVASVRAPKIQPSLRVSLLSARLLRKLLPLAGKSFGLDDASIKMSSLHWYCDCAKARAELGFNTRDPIETLRATVEDLRRRA